MTISSASSVTLSLIEPSILKLTDSDNCLKMIEFFTNSSSLFQKDPEDIQFPNLRTIIVPELFNLGSIIVNVQSLEIPVQDILRGVHELLVGGVFDQDLNHHVERLHIQRIQLQKPDEIGPKTELLISDNSGDDVIQRSELGEFLVLLVDLRHSENDLQSLQQVKLHE
ncbi:hypothetical protein WICPIJ_000194 [Wickerhamomyces pijperi]|uniref:Uncharacterized protein n=1 Tax=Wickerhamomyces pijperi TaxID=599730 RepID=A0A9P8TSC7_WICPI|nr:hypothetical protein WICPIJ_000194 [Wickerhamomyces pijperi]